MVSIFWSTGWMDIVVGTIGFIGMLSIVGLLDIVIDKYQYRSELFGF
jgi:uncharacterized membrane protein